jgi:hypothetical protein
MDPVFDPDPPTPEEEEISCFFSSISAKLRDPLRPSERTLLASTARFLHLRPFDLDPTTTLRTLEDWRGKTDLYHRVRLDNGLFHGCDPFLHFRLLFTHHLFEDSP